MSIDISSRHFMDFGKRDCEPMSKKQLNPFFKRMHGKRKQSQSPKSYYC